MTERVMSTDALQAFLTNTLHAEKVLVRENNRIITIEPVEETEYCCPLWGIAKGGALTVDKFLETKQKDKELEDANDERIRS
jgi:hypothetical protein